MKTVGLVLAVVGMLGGVFGILSLLRAQSWSSYVCSVGFLPSQRSGGWRLKRRSVTWTNWTFGVWWGPLHKRGQSHFGVDVGPLELVWVYSSDVPSRRRGV